MSSKTNEVITYFGRCRCCLDYGYWKNMWEEHYWEGEKEIYVEMLKHCFSLSWEPQDLSKEQDHICESCVLKLREANQFKKTVLESQLKLMEHFEDANGKEEPDNINIVDNSLDDPDYVDDPQEMDYEEVEFLEEEEEKEIESKPKLVQRRTKGTLPPSNTKWPKKLPKSERFKRYKQYPEEDLRACLEAIRNEGITITEASKRFNIPRKTLSAKIKGIIQESDSTITMKSDDAEDIKLTILKYPISLDSLEYEAKYESNRNDDERPITKTENDKNGPPKKRVKNVGYQLWKQNALVIFENSYVYPFIHSVNKYKCFICSKLFLDARYLEQHTNEHNINEMKRKLNNRARDKNLKVDVTNMKCKICFQTTSDLQELKNHLKGHGKNIEPNLQDNIIPFKLGEDCFNCQICNEPYVKLRLLIIHMSKHFNNYSCEICGAAFISSNLLKRHQKIHESGWFPCDKCDKVFSNASKRTAHFRGVHLKQFPRRCPICPQRFNSNYQRTKHLRIVHNQTTGLYTCDTCGREYDLKYHLLIHIRSVHLQERNQECPVCHSRFFSKYSLSMHMVIHTGEKHYKCEVCGKTYARRNHLREHSRSHDI